MAFQPEAAQVDGFAAFDQPGTMLSDYFPASVIFGICACAHALATLCQVLLPPLP